MGANNHYKASEFITAIPGSGGIISTIAARVGCSWHTAKKYITEYATVRQAYDDEVQKPLDMAESIILKNLELAAKRQKGEGGEMVDTGDAKWMLTMKGADRGYAPKQRHEVTGAEGGPIEMKDVTISDEQRNRAISALASAIAAAVHSDGTERAGDMDAGE